MRLAHPTSARLVVEKGFSKAILRAELGLPALAQGAFEGKKGALLAIGGNTVRVRFPGTWPWSPPSPELTLAAEPTWEIDIRGGMSGVRADLGQVRIASFTIAGGVNDLEVSLGAPVGPGAFRLSGGANHLVIRRPKEVGVRLTVGGGAAQVALDDSFFGSVGGKLRMESSNFGSATQRYDVVIAGGVNHLKIGTE